MACLLPTTLLTTTQHACGSGVGFELLLVFGLVCCVGGVGALELSVYNFRKILKAGWLVAHDQTLEMLSEDQAGQ